MDWHPNYPGGSGYNPMPLNCLINANQLNFGRVARGDSRDTSGFISIKIIRTYLAVVAVAFSTPTGSFATTCLATTVTRINKRCQ